MAINKSMKSKCCIKNQEIKTYHQIIKDIKLLAIVANKQEARLN